MAISSAYIFRTASFKQGGGGRSLKNVESSKGHLIDPWGTPVLILVKENMQLPTVTACDLSDKYSVNHKKSLF